MTHDVVTVLATEAKRISARVPSARWYIFGSANRDMACQADYDIAIICATDREVIEVREELDALCFVLPLHLFLATEQEEAELDFVSGQRCRQIFPQHSVA